MYRLSALLLTLLLPFTAVGQSVGGDNALARQWLEQPSEQMLQTPFLQAPSDVAVPLWHGTGGRLLMLKADRDAGASAMLRSAPLSFHALDASGVSRTGLQYGLTPNLQAHADVSEHSWVNRSQRVIGSEVGATYSGDRYSVGLSVGSSHTPDNHVILPRVLPGAIPGVDGLSSFDSSTQLHAHGRLALGSQSGIDLGASVGRIHLLPGNLLGAETLDQKALSFGVDHGSVSGTLVGRSMRPLAGAPGVNNLGPERRWTSIDLGVTWHLPWQGSLSVGAQNLWSSGTPANTPIGPEPDQSRTPYVQYHQDL